MKKLIWVFASTLLLSNLFLSTGCKDDPVTAVGPLVSITDGPLPGETVVGQNSTVTVTVQVTKGDKALKALTVLEDDVKVPLARLTVDGSPAAANPILILGTDVDGFTWEIKIDVQDAFDTRTYTIRTEDEGGATDEESFNVTVTEGLTAELPGVLWNQAGPAGKGAIDLNTGETTGTGPHASDPNDDYLTAELRDMGIDSLSSNEATEWRQRVGAINGTVVKYLGNGTPEGVDFEKVVSKDAIVDAYDIADNLTAADAISGNPGNIGAWGSFKVSDTVLAGDIFVVKNSADEYFLVRIDQVIVEPGTNDNDDRYIISIKY